MDRLAFKRLIKKLHPIVPNKNVIGGIFFNCTNVSEKNYSVNKYTVVIEKVYLPTFEELLWSPKTSMNCELTY